MGASSSREYLTMLRRICKYAAHLHLMRSMEVFVKLPQMGTNQTKPFSPQEQAEVQEFVLAAPTPRKAGLLLQMQLGLRIGEVCGLQWGDFDFKAGILTVRRTVSRIYCGVGCTKIVVQTPKTKSSGREIPIPHDLAALLRKLRGNAGPRIPGSSRAAPRNRWNPVVTEKASVDICAGPGCAGCIPTPCGIPLPPPACKAAATSKH